MTYVPNATSATIADPKIRDFALNPAHPQNKGRAAFFERFGFSPRNWEILRNAMLRHVTNNHVIASSESVYGTFYTVQCNVSSPDGRNPCIYSVWVVEKTGLPKFVTTYPGRPPK